ncbi:hypothetical protein ACFYNL_22715 [Streptomyces sp. NPDC007808]|uniref:hypothetical protein n=1 Tax=Streptomyces sp. NPDC007808 TaxID=3364779 RepID=UPI0036B53F6D
MLPATWAREPLLRLPDTSEGRDLTSLGADEPGKQVLSADLLSADLLRAALFMVDERELAASTEDLAAVGSRRAPPAADATLRDVPRGDHPGRVSARSRTV